jgi:hypothetical protein
MKSIDIPLLTFCASVVCSRVNSIFLTSFILTVETFLQYVAFQPLNNVEKHFLSLVRVCVRVFGVGEGAETNDYVCAEI